MRETSHGHMEPVFKHLEPQSQGSHWALKSKVSWSMDYGNRARYSVSDPLDVCLRAWKKRPFHSTPKDSLQASHPPSNHPPPSPGYAPCQVAWPKGVGRAPCHCVWRWSRVMRDLGVDVLSQLSNIWSLNPKAATEPSNQEQHSNFRWQWAKAWKQSLAQF